MIDKTIKACLVWACLSFTGVHSKVLKDEVLVKKETFHSFSQVCKHLTQRDSPLIEIFSINKLDCMGEIVEVLKFCAKERSVDPYFSRAFVDKERNRVVCQSASRVSLAYLCEKEPDEFCQDKEIGCHKLKNKFAHSLKLQATYFGEAPRGQTLNCHYAAGSAQEAFKRNL